MNAEYNRRCKPGWWLIEHGGFVKTRLPLTAYRRKLRPLWWVIHNVVAHPLIGVCPMAWAFRFHDWTGAKKETP